MAPTRRSRPRRRRAPAVPRFDPVQPHTPPRPAARLLPLLLGLVVLLALIGAVLQAGDAARFARIAQDAQPGWLVGAVLLQATTYTSEAGVWWLVLRRAGTPMPFQRLYSLAIVALLTSQTVPSAGMAGTFVVFHVLRHWGVSTAIAMATILVEIVAYYAAYGIFAGVGLALLADRGPLPAGVLAMAIVVVLTGLAIGGAALWATSSHRRAPRPWKRLKRVGEVVAQLSSADPQLARDPTILGTSTLLRGGNFALDAVTLWVCLAAVGAPTPAGDAVAAFLVGSVVRTVGFVPGGLGTFEAAAAATLVALGMDMEPALAAVLLFRGLSYWLPMPVGLVLSRRLVLPPEVTG